MADIHTCTYFSAPSSKNYNYWMFIKYHWILFTIINCRLFYIKIPTHCMACLIYFFEINECNRIIYAQQTFNVIFDKIPASIVTLFHFAPSWYDNMTLWLHTQSRTLGSRTYINIVLIRCDLFRLSNVLSI